MELNMVPDDQKTEDVPPAEVPEDLPLPSDPKVIFLGGLFVLAMLAAAYVASEIVLPLVFAIVLKLLLQPALRVLERLHVPRILAALLLILALFGAIVGLGTAISGPARTWAAKLPEGIPRLEERLSFIRAPINTLQLFFAAGGKYWPNGTVTKWGHFGARCSFFTEPIHRDPKLCQRLLHDGAVSFLPSRVWRYFPSPPRRDTPAL
jgi:AI-2E family transporter